MLKLFSFLARFAQGAGFTGDSRWLRRAGLLALIASVITGVSNTALLALIHQRLAWGNAAAGMVWAFAGLCLLLAGSRFLSQVLLVRFGQGAVLGLRMYLGRRILEAPLRRLETIGAHRLFAILTDDVTSIAGAVTFLPLMGMHVAILLSSFVYLGYLSWVALLVFFACMIAGIASYRLLMGRAMHYFRLLRQTREALVEQFTAVVQGNKELKLHGGRRDAFLGSVLAPTLSAFRRHSVASDSFTAGILTWGRSFFFIIVGLMVFGLPRLGWVGREEVTGYAVILLFIVIPLETVLALIPELGRAWVSIRRIEELGFPLNVNRSGEKSAAVPSDDPAPRPWSHLELAGLRFAYGGDGPEESFTLGPLDLELRAGEVVFLIGGNGSGKTTLGKLVTGLYGSDNGEIRVDGQRVEADGWKHYRQCFSAVFSDFHLFEQLLGVEAPDLDARARAHLEKLRLQDKLRIENGRLSNLSLSQGQRKRLALLMAYLEDRPCYLFDEWAADQDHEFKKAFYLELLPELKARGKTVFVVTHDDHYFEAADRIVKLDSGQVVFDGSAREYQDARLADWSSAEPGGEITAVGGKAS